MSSALDTPNPPEPRRFSIRLPRPLWIGVATLVLVVIGVALRIGLPICREQAAIREIKRLGGQYMTSHGGPDWLRKMVGDDRMLLFDKVYHVRLSSEQITDTELKCLMGLEDLQLLQLQGTHVTHDGVAALRRAFPKLNMVGPSGEAILSGRPL